jgi:hypothetical protein
VQNVFFKITLKATAMEFPRIKTLLDKTKPLLKMKPGCNKIFLFNMVFRMVGARSGEIYNLPWALKRLLKIVE